MSSFKWVQESEFTGFQLIINYYNCKGINYTSSFSERIINILAQRSAIQYLHSGMSETINRKKYVLINDLPFHLVVIYMFLNVVWKEIYLKYINTILSYILYVLMVEV